MTHRVDDQNWSAAGYELFANKDSLRRYEQQVLSEDDKRFRRDMERLAQTSPEAAEWLAAHPEVIGEGDADIIEFPTPPQAETA